jgi:hypothetical protein
MKTQKLEKIHDSIFRVINLEEHAHVIGGTGPISAVVTVTTTNILHLAPDTPDRIIDGGDS